MASLPQAQKGGLPLDLIAQVVPRLSRHDLEALTERLIEALDEQDGDLDLEPNGDELDGTAAEDDFYPHSNWKAEPGCPIADPDSAVDDGPCDEPSQDLEPEDYDDEFSDPAVRMGQRRRIQRTRCWQTKSRWGGVEHRLYQEPTVPTRRQLLRRKRGMPRRPRA